MSDPDRLDLDPPTEVLLRPVGADRVPALGPVLSVGRRRVAAVLVTVVVVVAAMLGVRASGVLRGESTLPPLPEISEVAPGVVRGAAPTDADLQRLRNDYGVRGVVAVGGASVETRASAQYLGVSLHQVAVDPVTGVPGPAELATLARFLTVVDPDRGRTGGFVYLYDGTGTGPVVATTLLVQVLGGEPPDAAVDDLDPATRASLTPPQRAALVQVAAAVAGDAAGAGPYAPLVGVRL